MTPSGPSPLHTTLDAIAGLITVHGHSVGVAAQFAISRRADGSAASSTGMCVAFLESQKLLGTESLIMSLRGRLDEVLEMCAEEEVAEIDEFTVVLVLDVDDSPSVLATANLLAIDDDALLRSDNGEGNVALLIH